MNARADREWIGVNEDLPQRDPRYRNISLEAEAKLRDGSVVRAIYVDSEKAWHYVDDDRHGFERIPEENKVTAWRSI